MVNRKLPRGIRNNNPLNIRISSSMWLGKVENNTDGSFEQFTSMTMGIRAAIKLVCRYIRDGVNTVDAIINRWAPPVENNTSMYIDRVCRLADLTPFQKIETKHRNAICRMLWAMTQVENGQVIHIDEFFKAYDLLFSKA